MNVSNIYYSTYILRKQLGTKYFLIFCSVMRTVYNFLNIFNITYRRKIHKNKSDLALSCD